MEVYGKGKEKRRGEKVGEGKERGG